MEEIKVAPIDEIPALVEQLIVLYAKVIFKLGELFLESEYMYYYGYHTDGSVGYWFYTKPNTFINYIESDLLRSFAAINIYGQNVLDGFTSPTQVCRDRPILNPIYSSGNNGYVWIMVFILILFIILFIIYLEYEKKK